MICLHKTTADIIKNERKRTMACYYWDDPIELHEAETIHAACSLLRDNNPKVRGLKLSPKTAIILSNANAEAFAEAIAANDTIVELHIEQIQVTHVKSLILIGKAIQLHPRLQRFRTADCQLGDAGAGIYIQLATNLRGLWLETDGIDGYGDFLGHIRLTRFENLEVLSLCDNAVDDLGCQQIMRGLADNSTLVELNLSCNYLTSVGAAHISTWMIENDSIKFLHLSWNSIGEEGAKILAKALKSNKTLDVLGLRGNDVGDHGAMALAEAIKTHPSLEILMLEDNKIGQAGTKAIANAYKENECITTMELSWNSIDEVSTRAICSGISNASYLYLSNCNLGNIGATILAAALGTNNSILELCLKDNDIGRDGAMAISQALAKNVTLESINLHGNLITNAGAHALREVVQEQNRTVRRIELDDAYAAYRPAINVFTAMNAVGRDVMLKSPEFVWQFALAKVSSDNDLLFLFLKEKPEAFQQRW